ncbi:MAG: endonuclease [Bacteroidales bacterium]
MSNYKFRSALTVLALSGGLSITLNAAPPTGYYIEADGLKKEELKSALHKIVSRAKMLSYGGGEGKTWQGFYSTDRIDDNNIWDMYSPIVRSFEGFNSISEMNIEHSLPKSWWGGLENNAYKDLFHLYPSDATANQRKSNHPLGIVTNPSYDNEVSKVGANIYPGFTGTAFEPANEFKGDFARTYLYMAVAYEDLAPIWNSPMMDNNQYPVWKPWAINLLREWCNQDPVSEKEIARADSVYNFQGNRNPFIDFPELVDYIWGKDTLLAYSFPAPDGPYLIEPIINQSLNLGFTSADATPSGELRFKGGNFSGDISLRWSQGGRYEISQSELTPQELLSGTNLQIERTDNSFGLLRDTLMILSEELDQVRKVAVESYICRDFLIEFPTQIGSTTADLRWITQPSAKRYSVDIFQENTKAGDLIFSSYVEGSSYNKAVEIYNGTTQSIDLSAYSLNYQYNGFGELYHTPLNLTGTIESGATYLIANPQASQEILDMANLISEHRSLSFNGDDPIVLLRDGVMIDLIGNLNSTTKWGENMTLYRKAGITNGANIFDLQEWNVETIDHIASLATHTMVPSNSRNYIFTDLEAGNTNNLKVEHLRPETEYIYEVKAYNEDNTTLSANSMRFKTVALTAPEAPEAEEITSNSIVLSWSRTENAIAFLLDIFTQVGDVITEELNFDNVDSKGAPMPQGWSNYNCSNYTSGNSSGKNPNSLGLKVDGAYIESPLEESNIIKVEFVYVSNSASSSSFTIFGKSNQEWMELATQPMGTSKSNFSLDIDEEKKIKAIKIVYNKNSGNMSMDDLVITRDNRIRTFVVKDEPIDANRYNATGLDPQQEYRFRLRSTFENIISKYSSEAVATTLEIPTSIDPVSSILVYPNEAGVVIEGANGDEQLRIYDLTGVKHTEARITNSNTTIPTSARGILLVHVMSERGSVVCKIVR